MGGGETMRITVSFFALFVAVAFVGNVFAVPSGKTVEYVASSEGKVIFDGKVHTDKGLKCSDCHPKLFPMKKGPGFKMADMDAGKACGACHNGEKVFKTSDKTICGKCHKK